jgi:phospholipase C
MRALLATTLVLSLAACAPAAAPSDASLDGGVDAGGAIDTGPHDAGVDARVPYDVGAYTRVPEATAAAGRASCTFARGAWPWETIGQEHPIGDAIPIRHFILLMQENRSFDHYYGTMPGVDGIPAGASNPHADGTPVPAFHTTHYCVEDPSHSWRGSHTEWNGGANDGFVIANNDMDYGMGYLDGTDLPFYWDLAQRFAMSDHHHCAVLGPTQVNREYFMSATSFGLTANDVIPSERYPLTEDHTLMQQLDRAGVSWHIYYTTVPWVWLPYSAYALRPEQRARMSSIRGFYDDLASGNLAEVVWLDPSWSAGGTENTDEHPPADPQFGQAWIRDVITHVMDSPIWNETAILFTYDEHGGFYDHVNPPEACPPGDFEPDLRAGDPPGRFDRYGFRVPLTVVSPYARAHYVSDHVTDHTSIVRLIQARYLLPAMTGRDANAWPLYDMFDFSGPTNTTRSSDLAAAPIDEARRTECRMSGL